MSSRDFVKPYTGNAVALAELWFGRPEVRNARDFIFVLVADGVGTGIIFDGQVYRVIGVGKKEGKTLGRSRDNWAIIPITSWMKQYGSHNSVRIWAKANGVQPPAWVTAATT